MTGNNICQLLVVVLMTTSAFGQKHVVYPAVPPPPHTPQEILLLFSGDTAQERILLTLNNNRPDVMTTSIAVYTATGQETVLPDVKMTPQESKLIELSPLLQKAGLEHQELGWIKLNYSGVTLEMGAQLSLYPLEGGPALDSARSLSSDFKSTARDAVFWMPEGGRARLSLINSSAASILVRMKCGPLEEEFSIPSKTTAVRRIQLPDGPIVHSGRVPISCEIVSDGAVDALRPVGSVLAPGYSAPVRFYDPKTATFPSLTSVGLATAAETHVTVHNLTGEPVAFTPRVSEAALANPFTLSLATRLLAPHDSAEVDLSDILRAFEVKRVPRVTLTLKTQAAKGSLVGAVTQIGFADKLVEDVPLRTSNPPAFARGSYPLRWDEDYTNLVTVTNTAEEVLRIGGQITAGSVTYVLTRTDIDPGATMVFDVDKWRRDGTPDVNGKTLPKDAVYGKFHWIEMSHGKKAGLLGRTSLASVSNRRKSSFSCGSTCAYNFLRRPYFDLQLPTAIGAGGVQVSAITEYDSYLNGSSSTYPFPYESVNGMYTSNASVASFGADSSNGTNINEYGNSPGSADVGFDFYDSEFSYDPAFEECTETLTSTSQSGTTLVQTPTASRIISTTRNQATAMCPAGSAGWDRVVLKAITDQNGSDLQAVQQLTEGLALGSRNDLNLSAQAQTGTATTNTAGQFTDELSFCSAYCPGSTGESDYTQGSSSLYQGIRYILSPNAFVYKCTSNTINGK